jgi:quinol monooxygenase YgiN
MAPSCTVIELRQYTLRSGQREVLIELFDRELVETQESVGCWVIGQFRDLDDANRFVWLRGFADMAARAQALQAFYGGPVWETHRDRANATMIDSDNVLLLRTTPMTAGP